MVGGLWQYGLAMSDSATGVMSQNVAPRWLGKVAHFSFYSYWFWIIFLPNLFPMFLPTGMMMDDHESCLITNLCQFRQREQVWPAPRSNGFCARFFFFPGDSNGAADGGGPGTGCHDISRTHGIPMVYPWYALYGSPWFTTVKPGSWMIWGELIHHGVFSGLQSCAIVDGRIIFSHCGHQPT